MNSDNRTQSLPADADLSKKESLRILGLAIALRENDDRMDMLLADFDGGFAKGWKMAVGSRFRDALDIKQTDRLAGGRKARVWAQGGAFCFSGGDTLYDTPRAYERWGTALQSIGRAYQVLGGTPSRPKKELVLFRRNASFAGSLSGNRRRANVARRKAVFKAAPVDWVELEELYSAVKDATDNGVSAKTLRELCDLGALERSVETIESRFPGTVRFLVMVPNADRSKLCVTEEKCMSQDDFVALLITGRCVRDEY